MRDRAVIARAAEIIERVSRCCSWPQFVQDDMLAVAKALRAMEAAMLEAEG